MLASIENLAEHEGMKAALRGVGFHSEKRTAVRDPEFRRLSPKVQEQMAGTSYETLRKTYDTVSVEDMRKELRGTA